MSYLNIVEPLEGIGQVAPVVAVVVAAGRKCQKRHIGIAASGCHHLSVWRPGLFILSTEDQQQFPSVKAVVAVLPQWRIAQAGSRVTVEQITRGAVSNSVEVATKRYGSLEVLWLGEQ